MENNNRQSLANFASEITDFDRLKFSTQIDLFAYFLIKVEKQEMFTPSNIKACFNQLDLPPHSNIPSYLSKSAQRNGKRNTKFYKKNKGYSLTPSCIEDLQNEYLSVIKTIQPTNKLLPTDLFKQSRKYVKKIAEEASISYDYQLYNGCSVLIRRILETLLIESFERKNITSRIKGSDDNYFFLSNIINVATGDPDLNLSRNTKQGLNQLKNLGDLSAHNRRYLASKDDIDQKKDSIRVVFEELLHIIDYPSWK